MRFTPANVDNVNISKIPELKFPWKVSKYLPGIFHPFATLVRITDVPWEWKPVRAIRAWFYLDTVRFLILHLPATLESDCFSCLKTEWDATDIWAFHTTQNPNFLPVLTWLSWHSSDCQLLSQDCQEDLHSAQKDLVMRVLGPLASEELRRIVCMSIFSTL